MAIQAKCLSSHGDNFLEEIAEILKDKGRFQVINDIYSEFMSLHTGERKPEEYEDAGNH